MKVIVCKNYDELSNEAFKIMKEVVTTNPKAVLGLATGSSPEGLYEKMIKDHQENGTSYKEVSSYNLDEYVGIDRNDKNSYYTFMNEKLFSGIDINLENTHVPYGNSQQDCDNYEKELSKVSNDCQVLGIGNNGHIGFNEPGTSFDILTHIVDLTQSTLEANSRYFYNDINKVPKQAMSMGIGTILKSKKIILLASGKQKADAIATMVNGTITTDCPATALQKHPDVTVIVDQEAGSKL